MAKGVHDQDLGEGVGDTPGCVRLRSSRPQDVALGDHKKWGLWGLDMENASLQADGFNRGTCFAHHVNGNPRTSAELGSCMPRRMVCVTPLRPFTDRCWSTLLTPKFPMPRWGSSTGFALLAPFCIFCFVRRVAATHTDGISDRGDLDVHSKAKVLSEALVGQWELQELSFVRVGMKMPQEIEYSARLTRAVLSPGPWPLGTSPGLWAARPQLLSPGDGLRCHCKFGGIALARDRLAPGRLCAPKS